MFDRDPATNPEQELWQAVLMRQVEDALYAVAGAPGNTFDYRLRACIDARHYLTTPSNGLSTVCANAGMDMHAVIDAMTKRIAEAPSPEQIASSKFKTWEKPKPEPKPKPIPFRDQSFTINGITRTATEWSLHTGINIQTMQSRMHKGWDIDRAFTATPEQVKQEKKAEMKRRAQRDIAGRTAKAKRTQNLTQQRHSTKPILYEYKGESLTLRGWSDRTGIAQATLYKRINKHGMTLAQAIESPIIRGRPRKQSA